MLSNVNRFLFIFIMLLFCSCEKVIDVDLNSASPKFVVEGIVTNREGPQLVRVTKTVDFENPNVFLGVEDAEVILSDSAGNEEFLTYLGKGFYATSEIEVVPGRTYFLTVVIGEEIFIAESTMPHPALIEDISISTSVTPNEVIYRPVVRYHDDSGTDNFYRHLAYINGQRVPTYFLDEDEGADGELLEKRLVFSSEILENEVVSGDTLTIEIQSLDQEVFNYFYTLDQTTNLATGNPANPISNIRGGALGYFSAQAVEQEYILLE